MRITPVARQRRHTFFFLDQIRDFSPVFLDTEVDMTAVGRHRAAARVDGHRYSVVTYLLRVTGRVLAAHPDANAAISGRLRARVARYDRVNGKLTLDKTVDGQRVVLAAVLPDLHTATLDEIQRQVDHYRDGDPDRMPEFATLRKLHQAPSLLGRAVFRLGTRPLRRRGDAFGTFAVTSLGHRPVDSFHSVGGTTVTLGVGQIADRPVVRGGELAIAPLMRLSLAFDHRVIDGAEAADVLTEIKTGLESFGAGPAAAPARDAPAHEADPTREPDLERA
ncbi:2-oxo acid dehydrogenase subunit E2 [Micromonospora sp. CA-244673]|uniref:2-oxo acid dehydrogenase subunit E2 n=1 Tax=Micromonospora sp. CA-244673 TaxID=3239958 RepID=UPI003D9016D6